MAAPLLTTKLFIPPARASLVARPQLLERLEAGLLPGRRLILLSAPIGFGKTTLLSAWIAQHTGPVRFSWLTLDEGDNDPARFLRYVIAAFSKLDPALGSTAQALLQAPVRADGLISPEIVLNTLLNDLAQVGTPLCLVLDDYHHMHSPAVHSVLDYLIDHLPPQIHLAIATRTDPSLPFARLRARDQIIELRVADLRFTSQEAEHFLNQVMQLGLSAEAVETLETRSEGWAAGLQLASLALQAPPQPQPAGSLSEREAIPALFSPAGTTVTDGVAAFTGSNRYVLDYLVEEVLARQPEMVQTFLLYTAVLERFNAGLCAELLQEAAAIESATPGTDFAAAQCQAILEALERANLFLIPLDAERGWYRYHNLFAEFLRSRLNSVLSQQGSPAKAQARIAALHSRASRWFEAHDLVAEAIEHALSAADFERAADLIDQRSRWSVLMPGEASPILQNLDAIPEAITRRRPGLCLTRAWALLAAGHNNQVEPYLHLALQAAGLPLDGLPDTADFPPEKTRLLGEVAAIRSLLAVMAAHLDESIQLAHQALNAMAPDELSIRSMIALNLGLAYDMRGEPAAAVPVYREALALGQAAANPIITLLAAVQLADLELLQGLLRQAEASYWQALRLSAPLGGLWVSGMVYTGLGRVCYEQNRLDEAARHFQAAIELGRRWESTDIYLNASVWLAQVRQAEGREGELRTLLEQAEQAMRGNISSSSTIRAAQAQMARIALHAGRREEASRWAREMEEQGDLPQAYLRVIEGATLARVLLAEARSAEAADLLAALLPESLTDELLAEIIELKAIGALAMQANGQSEAALHYLEEALSIAEAQGFARVFLDEGAPMARLLRQALARGLFPEFIPGLLDAFPCGADAEPVSESQRANQRLVEPLSERELDVLRQICEGRSNQEIAARLVLAVSTVKTHINNIYGKLGVQTRAQAIARARQLRLLE